MTKELVETGVSVLVALVFLAVAFAARREATKIRKTADEVSDAVNHRHLTGTPRLYDLSLELREEMRELRAQVTILAAWREKWRHMDPSIADGEHLSEKLDDIGSRISRVEHKLDDHVAWEMSHPATERK